ncbi:MAG: hypothetical protein JKY03_14770 [Aureispira sp.]|nr:hypothetical protein [Aureispira sp.]
MAIMNHGRLVYQGTPQKGIDELQGKVWQKMIERNEVEAYQSKYYVISDKLIAGKPLIHILDEANPENGFEAIAPSIEDVFFSKIKKTSEANLSL